LRLVLLLGLTPVLGVLSLPLSLLLTDALAEIPYLSMQLRCSLQYTHHEILQLFGAISRALVVAAVTGGLWMLVPAASGWGGLMAHGVAVCLILGCAYWFIEPQMRQASAATLRFVRARVPGGAR
jgi:hypothetical protein